MVLLDTVLAGGENSPVVPLDRLWEDQNRGEGRMVIQTVPLDGYSGEFVITPQMRIRTRSGAVEWAEHRGIPNQQVETRIAAVAGGTVTFDWSADLADIEGGVFKQLGFTLEQRSGYTETYVRTDPVNQAMALSPVARIRIDLNTTGTNGGVVFLLPRRSNNQNANIPEDDTRSVILRVTLPDATSFTGLFRLADEGSPGPDSPYHFFRDDYATADALLNFLPDYDANLAVTLDFAVVENSAGWRQNGTNVERSGQAQGGQQAITMYPPRSCEMRLAANAALGTNKVRCVVSN